MTRLKDEAIILELTFSFVLDGSWSLEQCLVLSTASELASDFLFMEWDNMPIRAASICLRFPFYGMGQNADSRRGFKIKIPADSCAQVNDSRSRRRLTIPRPLEFGSFASLS